MAKVAFVDLTLDSDDEDAARMDKQRTAAQTQAAAKSQTDTRREGCSTTSKAVEQEKDGSEESVADKLHAPQHDSAGRAPLQQEKSVSLNLPSLAAPSSIAVETQKDLEALRKGKAPEAVEQEKDGSEESVVDDLHAPQHDSAGRALLQQEVSASLKLPSLAAPSSITVETQTVEMQKDLEALRRELDESKMQTERKERELQTIGESERARRNELHALKKELNEALRREKELKTSEATKMKELELQASELKASELKASELEASMLKASELKASELKASEASRRRLTEELDDKEKTIQNKEDELKTSEATNALLNSDLEEKGKELALVKLSEKKLEKQLEQKCKALQSADAELKKEREDLKKERECVAGHLSFVAKLQAEKSEISREKETLDGVLKNERAKLKQCEEWREAALKQHKNKEEIKDRELARLTTELQDKNRLIQQMKLSEQQSKRQAVAPEQQQISDGTMSSDKTNDKIIDELQDKLTKLSHENAKLKAEHDQEKAKLKAEHEQEKQNMEADHESNLVSMKKTLQSSVAQKEAVGPAPAAAAPAAADKMDYTTKAKTQPVKILRKLVFSAAYHYGRGDPFKDNKQAGRPVDALPYDDAFGATSNCLVLCDGVGGGGAASGQWARACVSTCLDVSRTIDEQLPSATEGRFGPRTVSGSRPLNLAEEVVVSAMKRPEISKFHETHHDSRATTTLLTLKLMDYKDEKNATKFRIDACEIGDSRWALLCLNTASKRFVCSYLADAHVHHDAHAHYPEDERKQPIPPFQIKPPGQQFGKGPEFYFAEFKHKCLHTQMLDLSSSSSGECTVLILAGSDGLWDNILGDRVQLEGGAKVVEHQTSDAIKKKLEETTNDFFENKGTVDKEYVRAFGNFLKNSVINQMASANGKQDDVSIFVGMIETRMIETRVAATNAPKLFESKLFDGSLRKEEIKSGVESMCILEPDADRPGLGGSGKETVPRSQGSYSVGHRCPRARSPLSPNKTNAASRNHPTADGKPTNAGIFCVKEQHGKRKAPPTDPRLPARPTKSQKPSVHRESQ